MESNIISKMISQHRDLQKTIGGVVELLKEGVKEKEILQGLEKFKADLVVHLKLENEEFYEGLIEQMEKGKQDTAIPANFY